MKFAIQEEEEETTFDPLIFLTEKKTHPRERETSYFTVNKVDSHP